MQPKFFQEYLPKGGEKTVWLPTTTQPLELSIRSGEIYVTLLCDARLVGITDRMTFRVFQVPHVSGERYLGDQDEFIGSVEIGKSTYYVFYTPWSRYEEEW